MKIERESLIEALDIVAPGIAKKELVVQSDSFVFTDNHICTFNDDISIKHPCEIDLYGAVRAEEFSKLMKKITAKEINIVIDKGQLVIASKRTTAKMVINEEITLPIQDDKQELKWKKLPKNFNKAVSLCLLSTSKLSDSQTLTCVSFSKDKIQSCDNDKMTIFTLDKEYFKKDLLISAKNLYALMNFKAIYYNRGKDWVHFKTEQGTIYSCRQYDFDYFDLMSQVEKGKPITFPKDMITLLDRAVIFSDQDKKQVKVSITNGSMVVTGQNEVGSIVEKSKIKYKGKDFEFNVIPEVLHHILKVDAKAFLCEHGFKFKADDFIHVVVYC